MVTLLNISREGMCSSEHPQEEAKSLFLGGCKVSASLEDNGGFVPANQAAGGGFVVLGTEAVHGTEQEMRLEH